MNQEYHIWNFIEKRADDECWPCKLPDGDARGHKHFSLYGKKVYAHRLVYKLSKGEIPEGLLILHLCSNPACCNPAHLKAGTKSENVKQSYRDNPFMTAIRSGSNNGRSKFTEDEVEAIRSSTDSHAACARRYKVNEVTIARIRKGLRYVSAR